MDESIRSFKEKLDANHNWPELYTFKFICVKEKSQQVREIFPSHEVKEKPSSKGKYVSLTVNIMARSSDEIIEYYQKVHEVGDVMSL